VKGGIGRDRFGRASSHPDVVLHFMNWLNAAFTVLKNTDFHRLLRARINCVEIVAP
jgi:hypothetical protein